MKILGLLLCVIISLNVLGDSSVGCGLGTVVLKENTVLSAVLRMTTNATFSSQLFGITSGTSNCKQHSIVKLEKAPVYYAEANIDNLKGDMAKGEGEYLDGFLTSMGCHDSIKDKCSGVLKNSYQDIFPEGKSEPLLMLNTIKGIFNKDNEIQKNCHYII